MSDQDVIERSPEMAALIEELSDLLADIGEAGWKRSQGQFVVAMGRAGLALQGLIELARREGAAEAHGPPLVA